MGRTHIDVVKTGKLLRALAAPNDGETLAAARALVKTGAANQMASDYELGAVTSFGTCCYTSWHHGAWAGTPCRSREQYKSALDRFATEHSQV